MAKENEDDSVWKANVEALLAATGSVPLGLYECPKPYHRCDAETARGGERGGRGEQWPLRGGRELCRQEGLETGDGWSV